MYVCFSYNLLNIKIQGTIKRLEYYASFILKENKTRKAGRSSIIRDKKRGFTNVIRLELLLFTQIIVQSLTVL